MSRIDLFAFGGGFTSVPLMYHEIVDVRSWMESETFMNGIALGQFTPGPIVITATFVGYLLYSIVGAIVATISVFFPSFLIVVGLVPYSPPASLGPFQSLHVRHTGLVRRLALVCDDPIRSERVVGCRQNCDRWWRTAGVTSWGGRSVGSFGGTHSLGDVLVAAQAAGSAAFKWRRPTSPSSSVGTSQQIPVGPRRRLGKRGLPPCHCGFVFRRPITLQTGTEAP